ncbi:MAG: hypothetical protein WC957_00825 [Candidatus Neomarinimicrobiota bacterium]|jgi:hypothetical protein
MKKIEGFFPFIDSEDLVVNAQQEDEGERVGFQIKIKNSLSQKVAYLKKWAWCEPEPGDKETGASFVLSRENAEKLLDSLLDALGEKDRLVEPLENVDGLEKAAMSKEISQLNAVIDSLLDAIKWLRGRGSF